MSKRKTAPVMNIKLPKRPMRQYHEVTFDRKKIRESIQLLTYPEAARLKGPMYVALQDEMFRAGCRILPEFLECISREEQHLFESQSIRWRITDPPYRSLFYEIIENLKKAELDARKTKEFGYKCYFLQYLHTFELLEPYKDQFEYFLKMLMEATIMHCNNLEGREKDSAEVITRILCKYTEYLQSIGDTPGAIKYLERALTLARRQSWLIDQNNKMGKSIYEFVGENLADLLLKYSYEVYVKRPKEAISMAQRAKFIAAEIGREKHMALFCNTFLTQADIFIAMENYTCAKRVLDKIKPEVIKRLEFYFNPMNIKFYLYQGRVEKAYGYTNKAISSLQEALRLSTIYEHHFLRAEILMSLGKIYATDRQKFGIARKCFEEAKFTFINSDDKLNCRKSIYLVAKLKADEIMPKYKYLIDNSAKQPCAFYKLRQWKNCLSPFWLNWYNNLQKAKVDPTYCIFEEENFTERKREPDAIVEDLERKSETEGLYTKL